RGRGPKPARVDQDDAMRVGGALLGEPLLPLAGAGWGERVRAAHGQAAVATGEDLQGDSVEVDQTRFESGHRRPSSRPIAVRRRRHYVCRGGGHHPTSKVAFGYSPTRAAAFSRNSDPLWMSRRRTAIDLCPVCWAITRSGTSAAAALVASPARRLWPA